MTAETHELIEICEKLKDGERREVADFARFLLARQDDARWEAIIDSPHPSAKLEAFMRESAAEPASPLDFERL